MAPRKKYGQTEAEKEVKEEKKAVVAAEVVTEDKYWAPNGIGHRMVKSDDKELLERLMKYGWLKEFKEK